MIISHADKIHEATVNLAEMNRQAGIATAVLAGGGSAAVGAAVKAVDIAFYRAVVASCLARGQSSSNFTQALRDLGVF